MKRTLMKLMCLGAVALPIAGLAANGEGRQPEPIAEFGPWSAPVNLGPVVNSTVNEAGPAISRDGLSLYFYSGRSGAGLDLYVARRAAIDVPWEPPLSLGPVVNSGLAEVTPTLSKNGHFLFFGSTRTGTFDVYVSRRRHTHDDFDWQAPLPLLAPINGASFEVPSDYFENSDGPPQLYFASDRLNGRGAPGLDIYVTERTADGTWSEPVYVTELNTAFQDDRPAVRFDGLEIIFNSSREGNLDLYVSRRNHVSEAWSLPENLGPAVNSPAGDIHPALSPDGTTLYFASMRDGSLGSFDLYVSTRSRLR
jgi:hypothetical protein